jgi:hypothetical protein
VSGYSPRFTFTAEDCVGREQDAELRILIQRK